MKMLRREHVPGNYETITPPRLLQHTGQKVAPHGSVQLGLATGATASNEMQVVLAVKAFQTLRHPGTIEC